MPPPEHGYSAILAALGGSELLFDSRHQKVYAFNEAAAAAWRGWRESGRDGAEAALIQLSFAPKQANSHVSALLAEWAGLGLSPTDLNPPDQIAAGHAAAPAGLRARGALSYAAGGFLFAIDCPDQQGRTAVQGLIGHLRAEADDVAFTFRIDKGACGYVLVGPGGRLKVPDADALAVVLKNEILEAVLERFADMIAIHAAAVAGPGGAILLPGTSGSGKTTLAAMLHARGLPLIADDVALLDGRRTIMHGLPFAFALKAGSWPVLAPVSPGLMQVGPRTRPDGRIVRYLPPSSVAEGARVAKIFFPKHTPDSPLAIDSMSKQDALVHLLSEARNASRRLSTSGFHALCMMIERADAHSLHYGRADDAADALLRVAEARD